MTELPVLQPATRAPRADAARNRERILCTARRLMAEQGPDAVSMDCVAAAAGVGKGTLYRRFGDRDGLVRALVEEQEIRFQDEMIRGAPPLGPGAPPRERLHAFGEALLAIVTDMAPFFVGDDRLAAGPYQAYRTHVDILLREALPPAAPIDYLGDALIVCLTGPHVRLQMRKGMTLEELQAGRRSLVDALLAGAGAGAAAGAGAPGDPGRTGRPASV